MLITKLTKENFNDEVVGCDKPVIIDFGRNGAVRAVCLHL